MNTTPNFRRWTGATLMMVASGLGLSTAAGAASHQIPLRMVGNYAVVNARIAGHDQPLRLIVDTAAGASALDSQLIEKLELIDASAQQAHVSGASGSAHSVQFARQLEIEMAGSSFAIRPLATDMSRFGQAHGGSGDYDGILGNDLLRRYEVTFDVPGGALTLSEAESDGAAHPICQANGFGAARPAHLSGFALVELMATADNQPAAVEAVVDTGAAQTLFNWRAMDSMGLDRDDMRLRDRAEGTRGFGGQRVDSQLFTLSQVRFLDWAVNDLEVRISDLPVFQALGLAEKPAVILGIDALQRAPLWISKGVERICIG